MFERWLMWQLLPDGRFGGVAPLLGSNFAAISVIYRLLGAKVGKRIYWPGSGNVMTEYDLFECGDDVTFGSRSTYLMTSVHGSRPIRIEPGANVADRCVLAPGVVVSRNAVLGSGTFAPEGFVAPAGSTWIGQDGREAPIELEAATPRRVQAETLRPYGRAMYMGEATYAVLPLGAHIVFNIAWAALGALYRTAPMIAALLLTRAVLIAEGPGLRNTADILLLLAGFYLPLHLTSAFGALGVLVATKWLIIGHRVEGEQFWTQSSYCQRWKIHSVISSLSSGWFGNRDLLAFLEGSAFLVWYFRAQGAQIGANVCLYPNGADPMMEEPDLLHIGDEVRIDQAVLIAHLNTRGEWMMGPIEIGRRACLRTASRVMMMSTVGERSTLLGGDADACRRFQFADRPPGTAGRARRLRPQPWGTVGLRWREPRPPDRVHRLRPPCATCFANLTDLPTIGRGPHPALGPLDVHVWHHDHEALMEREHVAAALTLLSPDEHERLARLRDDRRRRQFLLGRVLCRCVLSRYAPVRPEDWRFRLGSRGKPSIAAPVLSSPLWFSLSHADGVSACAVTGAGPEIGIDIERMALGSDALEVAAQFFPEAEVNALRRLPRAQRGEAFVRFWALKESFVKARGTSLADGLSGTTFDLDRVSDIGVTFAEPLNELAEQWRFKLFQFDQFLIFALAVRPQATGDLKMRVGKWQCLGDWVLSEQLHRTD